MIHVPSNEDSPIIYKGDAVQISKDFIRLVDDMHAHGYNKIATDLLRDRIFNRLHNFLPIEHD